MHDGFGRGERHAFVGDRVGASVGQARAHDHDNRGRPGRQRAGQPERREHVDSVSRGLRGVDSGHDLVVEQGPLVPLLRT